MRWWNEAGNGCSFKNIVVQLNEDLMIPNVQILIKEIIQVFMLMS